MHSTIRSSLFALLLLAAASASHASTDLTASLWKNPIFQKSLVGSFGMRADLEPPLSDEERTVFDEIAPVAAEKPAEAIQRLEAYLKENPEASAQFDFLLGNLYFAADRKPEAGRQFVAALRKHPEFQRAHKNLAILCVQLSRPTDAIRHFTEALKLGGEDGTLFGLLGTSYLLTEAYPAAETAFRQAALFEPEVADWQIGLARSLFAQQKFGELLTLTRSLLGKRPEDADLWMLRAGAEIGLKDFDSAAASYEVLRGLGKAPAGALQTLADLYVNQGLPRLAAELYTEAMAKDPVKGLAATLRAAEVLLARDDAASARTLLRQARAGAPVDPHSPQMQAMLRLEGKIALAQREDAAAAELLEKAVALDPLDGDSLLALGQTYVRLNQPDKAIFALERAGNIEKFEADAKVRHAQVLVAQKRYPEAIPLLRRAQELKPRDNVGKFLDDLERFVRGRR